MSCHHTKRNSGRITKGAMDILVEELAKDAALGLLIGHALATSSILVVLLLLEGFECRHPAGTLGRVSTLMARQKKKKKQEGNKKQKKQSSGELREVMQDGDLLVGEGRCRWWWWEKSGLVRS